MPGQLASAAERTAGAEQAAMGFEPMNNGFAIRHPSRITPDENATYNNTENHSAPDSALCAQNEPDLAIVTAVWSGLPESARAAILAIVHGAGKGHGS